MSYFSDLKKAIRMVRLISRERMRGRKGDAGVDETFDYPGVINFDGVDDKVTLSADLNADITNNKTVTFRCYLDSDVSNSSYTLFAFKSAVINDYLAVLYSPGQQLIIIRKSQSVSHGGNYDVSTYQDQVLSCEVVKTSGAVSSFKINGNTIAKIGSLALTAPATSDIGFYGGQGIYGKFLSIWDILVKTTGGADLHSWAGYPSGASDAAWVDGVGSINGTVVGSPDTRNL